ncbi:MAG: thioredoxin family protein [Eubacteriales bacterium]|nr:thioredoxin family protein [Eubacteriales bacterium]
MIPEQIPEYLEAKSPLLDEALQEQLAAYLTKMPQPVTLKLVYDQEQEKSLEAANFYLACAALSPQLNLELYRHTEVPADLLEEMQDTSHLPYCALYDQAGQPGKVSFVGIPGGKEINSFLLAILRLSGFAGLEPSEDLRKALADLDQLQRPQHIYIMVSLACSHCSKMVENCQAVALASQYVSAQMIDATLFPDLIEKYKLKRVPFAVLDQVEVLGEKTPLEIVEILRGQIGK